MSSEPVKLAPVEFVTGFAPDCEGIKAMKEWFQYAEYRHNTGAPAYISPKEMRHMEETKKSPVLFECAWPNCSCERVSGIYNRERVQWLINQARKDPEFGAKDVRFVR